MLVQCWPTTPPACWRSTTLATTAAVSRIPDENLPALRPPACRRSDRLGRSCEQGRRVTGITRADSASEIRSSAGGKFQSTCNAEDLGHAPPRNSCRYDNSRAGGFPTVLRAPGLRRAGGGPLENPSLPARPHSRAGYPCAFCGQSDGPHEASSPRQDTNPLVPKRGNLSRADRLHAQHPANQGRPPRSRIPHALKSNLSSRFVAASKPRIRDLVRLRHATMDPLPSTSTRQRR